MPALFWVCLETHVLERFANSYGCDSYLSMEDRPNTPSKVQTGQRSLIEIARSVGDPCVAVICLYLSSLTMSAAPGPAELVLAALTFSLSFPSSVPFSRRQRDLIRTVLGNWLTVLGLLLALGAGAGLLSLFQRDVLILWALVTPAAQLSLHYVSPLLLRRALVLKGTQKLVIVGANDLGRAFARSIAADRLSNSEIVAFFDDRDAARIAEPLPLPLCGRVSDVGRYVRANGVDQIYIALPMASQPRILDLLNDLRDSTASIYFLPDIFMFDLIQARVDTMSSFPVVAVCETPFQGARGAFKRAVDVLVAAIALLSLLPLMIAIGIAVKWTSPGPAIFKQRRFGLDGCEITVYKFRSMTVTEDGKSSYEQVTRGDPRVTRLGAFLRKTSLDELPQFINVLQGRMSVVGPRPHAIMVNDQYRKLIPGYMMRHKVRPGITGWAQVHGFRGGDDLGSMSKRIEYDLNYLRDWTPWMDLMIIIRTVMVVFKDSKAF